MIELQKIFEIGGFHVLSISQDYRTIKDIEVWFYEIEYYDGIHLKVEKINAEIFLHHLEIILENAGRFKHAGTLGITYIGNPDCPPSRLLEKYPKEVHKIMTELVLEYRPAINLN